ncbi:MULTISPECIES: sensor histidine kinase [Actinokineospora]|uniref:histidine kinase n=1 Tax=Actinokineospora fastidiosa TaxID=1816 RepID=A0A918LDF7_9PSEU|nr:MULTISPECIES: HAMP domain-containing sensor histidine kinase [Actinokineospora]UVS79980.1 Sensor histidine kinase MtrB [Actinokineospora sp. UTMC 2448]GGS32242.1 two-component sensor histidine kinase [Actinokineospora fastidiosa]
MSVSGLRGRVMLTFAVGGALLSLLMAVAVFAISRGYLTEQRERSAERLAAADADFIASRLAVPGATAEQALAFVDPPKETSLVLEHDGRWLSASGDEPPDLPPDSLRRMVAAGESGVLPVTVQDRPYLVAGVPMAGGSAYYEFTPAVELQATIRVLGTVLILSALAATGGAALLGRWASGRVLAPLRALSGTASSIASGNLDSRLPEDNDRDLSPMVRSFNAMVDSLQSRIARERRFVGDVTHELRTPLTTLVTSVQVMERHAEELPERSRRALSLVSGELDHLRGMLEDLLDLARAEAGLHSGEVEALELRELLANVLSVTGRPADLLDAPAEVVVPGRKLALVRAMTNLLDNADRHGGGVTALRLRVTGSRAAVEVDDDGPGVPPEERDRVFARFATGRGARGSSAGTGLGLALVAETVAAHGGNVHCGDSPTGGARFTVTLPVGEPR